MSAAILRGPLFSETMNLQQYVAHTMRVLLFLL